jgi:transposase-like protein
MPAEKVALLRRHLIEKVPVSTLCEEQQLNVNVFYNWLKQFFENGAAAFERSSKPRRSEDAKDRRIEQLEAKLVQKHEVISELMEENVRAKKSAGEL